MIQLTDSSVIDFKKVKNNRFEMSIKIANNKTIVIHLDRSSINLLQFELEELLKINDK